MRETGLALGLDRQQPVVEPLQQAPRRGWDRGRLELEAITVNYMNELKRSGVVGGKAKKCDQATEGDSDSPAAFSGGMCAVVATMGRSA